MSASANRPSAAAEGASLLRPDGLVTAVVLSAGAGLLDAFAYVGHGHAFASFMTGNMVLLGLNLGSDNRLAIYVLPILAYIVGVVIAQGLMRDGMRRILRGRPQIFALLVEILVLGGLALLPHHFENRVLVPIITMSTAMQNTSFRSLGQRTYNSVFMTGNLQAFSSLVAEGLTPPSASKLRDAGPLAAVILSFFCGAVCGGLLTLRLDLLTLLVPAGALALLCLALLLPRPPAAALIRPRLE